MLALETLSAGWQAVFYGIAVVLFVLAALGARVPRINLVAAGLAFAFFPAFWNNLAGA